VLVEEAEHRGSHGAGAQQPDAERHSHRPMTTSSS
jgi:hypothetical protein